jgi:hypothetical protein
VVNGTQVPLESIRIAGGSGRVRVRAIADLDEVSIDGAAVVVDGTEVTVDGGSSRVEVRMPEGLDLVIGTSSGRVDMIGRAGTVAVVTKSGRVSIDEAEAVDVRAGSARVDIGDVVGECRVVGAVARSRSVAVERPT